MPATVEHATAKRRHIELKLRDIHQLFNTMDPSPFHEKDLDHDAEEFIFSWAQEFHRHEPVDLIVHLESPPAEGDPARIVADSIHNYFKYRARMNQLEFKRLLKQGRISLLVGLCFLGVCLGITGALPAGQPGSLHEFLHEGLTIAGWVAMWRPLEIYLYDWWPLRRQGAILAKLGTMPVRVHVRGGGATTA
ncbi:MAG TPA: hypothetical protein DCM86_17415 [Verrucomicrobiales bacterium]|nr:hypothetical protein [Verrucomicrobiales bacterium]